MDYCTRDEVLSTVVQFQSDYDQNVITDAMLDAAIAEGSEIVRGVLTTNYLVSAIEALSPLPPAVNYCAKYMSSMILLRTRGAVDIDQSRKVEEMVLQQEYNRWVANFSNGFLLKADGTIMPTRGSIVTFSEPVYAAQITEVYARGARQY